MDDGLILIEGAKIRGVWESARDGPIPQSGADVIVVRDGYVAPGYVDIHVHGGGGADVSDGDAEAVATVARTHVRHGTTTLLATTVTAPEDRLLAAIRAMTAATNSDAPVAGIHLEGPFISTAMRGAQGCPYIRAPSLREVEHCLEAGALGWRWQVTLAPGLPGAAEVIRFLVEHGVVVSAGNTHSSYQEMRRRGLWA